MYTDNHKGFTESFKIHVVLEIESGKLTMREASRKYSILGHSTILRWCRKYGKKKYQNSNKGKQSDMPRNEHELLHLSNEIKTLKQELAAVRANNIILETLVDVAEKKFEIPIRKKYGAKQSVK